MMRADPSVIPAARADREAVGRAGSRFRRAAVARRQRLRMHRARRCSNIEPRQANLGSADDDGGESDHRGRIDGREREQAEVSARDSARGAG